MESSCAGVTCVVVWTVQVRGPVSLWSSSSVIKATVASMFIAKAWRVQSC